MAYATYEIVSARHAVITVDYANGGFGMERVETRHACDLYDACYSAASVKAALQGERLERLALEER